jgi:mitochondrial enoyl-[acyl-carrier protein] reductase / trans-2-enoyl-CoA reductase
MDTSIYSIVYEAHGNPSEVLRLEQCEIPAPAADEAVVALKAAPINPADLNAIEGKYPIRPPLPATPGFEGAGIVIAVGAAVKNVSLGAMVILPHDVGTWREACIVKAEHLIVLPQGIDPVQAAMLKINPMTAWRMLHDFVQLRPRDWLIQNAANSAAGRAVIQISRELGYRTVNIVRRPELIEELKKEGGDVVLCDGKTLREEVATQTERAPIRLALNAVGGESALRIANTLAPNGTIVTYGAMSLQPLRIPNGLLIFKNLSWRGIWINKWYDNATTEQRMDAFRPLFEMAKRGLLRTKVEKAYPLKDFAAAVARAAQSKRDGKVIFKLGD